jgi:hypothetical protein
MLQEMTQEEIEREIEEKEKNDAIVKLFSEVVETTNRMRTDNVAALMLEAVNHSHRYLQGEFIQALINFMRLYGDQSGNPRYEDGRNEWALKAAKRMADAAQR